MLAAIFLLFTYLAVLGPRCFVDFFSSGGYSSCSARTSHFSGSSCCRARVLGHKGFSSCSTWAQRLRIPAFRAQTQYLWYMGFVALWHVGSFWTGDLTRVLRIGRQTLYH